MTLSDPAKALEAGGFRRSVAPVDFDAIVRAARKAQETKAGLLLSGTTGCGKTLAVNCLAPKPPPYPSRVQWIDMEEPVHTAWLGDAGITSEMFRSMRAIVLDDLGMEVEESDFGVFRDNLGLFVSRYQRKKDRGEKVPRLFITTNLSSRQISKKYGDRVLDRILGAVVPVKMTGKSQRKVGF